ncbi:Uu.00g005620.m01.CDS01 [Anthostomella pinea]|uniref:Uu.00g005620.m01.CDS01 n=1 Tax=Anthostomella pinea TaxID=933095 RepID=A0AAI8VKV8_9PEZI|nr:Uu.00g005620.m01.CDS01 [Anthostomella pinea]
MSLKNVAVFGANGQLGQSITNALLKCKKQTFNVLAVIPPGSQEPTVPSSSNYKCQTIDVLTASRDELKSALKESTLSSARSTAKPWIPKPISRMQPPTHASSASIPASTASTRLTTSQATTGATCTRCGTGRPRLSRRLCCIYIVFIHFNYHPAVDSEKMSYTLIGCGDFYNQGREAIWCPWTQHDPPNGTYTFHVIGPPGAEKAKADFTHIDDFANFLVATLDTVSHGEIVALLEKYSGKKVRFERYGEDDMHRIVAKPDSAPDELRQSAFPVDFWFLVKGAQGTGTFRRPGARIVIVSFRT